MRGGSIDFAPDTAVDVMSRAKRPTAADVAEAVGVSKTTVSYVFNESKRHKISPATVERVLREADRIGFRPNRMAGALRTGRRLTVVALLPDWDMGPGWTAVLQVLGDRLSSRGYSLAAVTSAPGAVPPWGDLSPGAVVSIDEMSPTLKTQCAVEGIKVLDPGVPTMLRRAGELGAETLHRAGYRRLGYLLPPPPFSQRITEWRYQGLVDYCTSHGLEKPPKGLFDPTSQGVTRMRKDWLEGLNPVDGIIAHNDEIGAFYFLALKHAGFDVGKIGIIGAGDRPISRLGLTTFATDVAFSMARRIAEAVTDVLTSDSPATIPMEWADPMVLYRESLTQGSELVDVSHP
ncbi:MAG: LacI family DNA-binding transcriptional regulator [Planctomycetaceae bacterium]